jgi:hypothetical protein
MTDWQFKRIYDALMGIFCVLVCQAVFLFLIFVSTI